MEWTVKWIIGSLSKQIFFHFSVTRECCCFCWLCSLVREHSSFPDRWYLLAVEICLEMFPVLEMQPGRDELTSCCHPEENCGLTVSLGHKYITTLCQEFVLLGHVYRAEHHKASGGASKTYGKCVATYPVILKQEGRKTQLMVCWSHVYSLSFSVFESGKTNNVWMSYLVSSNWLILWEIVPQSPCPSDKSGKDKGRKWTRNKDYHIHEAWGLAKS